MEAVAESKKMSSESRTYVPDSAGINVENERTETHGTRQPDTSGVNEDRKISFSLFC